MNFAHYEGKGIDIRQLIDLCETMPFFANRRVIILEDTGFFKNKCDGTGRVHEGASGYLCRIFVDQR